ncbi:MAG: DUF4010 domain-containing protein [Gammaproteobacteria bacterium]|nr:DUF4010 domain-containing protein [Gammaproteobacteria bacterium]
MDLLDRLWASDLAGVVVALAVGLLIGIERERRKRDPGVGTAGGLRTHVVVALAGAIAVQFPGVGLLIAGACFIAALVVVAYWRDRSSDPGLTSEITLFTTYLLGALAPRLPELAAGVGVVIALVLGLRTALHTFVSKSLTDRELLDLQLLAAAALVVWPLMPDTTIDRHGVINPRAIWGLTLLVLLINAAGYVALRRYGPTRGLPLAGFFGGFVSSTATIGAMGARAAAEASALRPAVAAALLSSVATPLQLIMLLALIEPRLLLRWWAPALAMAVVVLVFAARLLGQIDRPADGVRESFSGRAFQPLQAIVFSVTVTSLIWAAAWLKDNFGTGGATLGIALGGIADAHSAIAGAASLVHADELSLGSGALAVLAALGSNAVMKLAVAGATGGRRFALALAPALLLGVLAASGVLFVSQSWPTAVP